MIETHQAHHSSSYSRTFLYCQVNSNLPAVSPSCSNTAADASLSCSVAGQGTVVWWNTCLWKQNKANICLLPCVEHSYGRNRVKKNNAKQLCRDAPSSSHLDNWSFDIIKRRRMSRNSLLLKNSFVGFLLPWLAFYLHAFLGPVMMNMKDTLREGLCIICGGRWSMACFNLPSWLHSPEKRYLRRASRSLWRAYTLGMSVTNTLVRLSIRRCRVTQAGHLRRTRSESFTVTSATFPVIQRPSLSTGKVWLLHAISVIAFSPSPPALCR